VSSRFPTRIARIELRSRDGNCVRAAVIAVCCALLSAMGCTKQPPAPTGKGAAAPARNVGSQDAQRSKDLFDSSIRSLQQLDPLANIARYNDPSARDVLATRLKDWYVSRQPPTAWEPDPNEALLDKITERLSTWVQDHAESVEWAADPMIETLPEDLRGIAPMKRLPALDFNADDGQALREALWVKTVSDSLSAETTGDLAAAEQMFDWVVRNIQLDGPGPLETGPVKPPVLRQFPWQAMLYGHGTAEERAWVFLRLARQQGLRVVILALPGEGGAPAFWLPALVHEGNFYLFDTQLGMPIPGPNGEGIATLAQVAADDALLRRLDLNEQRTYPVKAEQLAGVTVWIEGSPAYLSRRMAILHKGLADEAKLNLAGKPSVWGDAVKGLPNVKEVKLWPLPQQTYAHAETLTQDARQVAISEFTTMIAMPTLWKARVFQWRKESTPETNPVGMFFASMPTDAEIQAAFPDPGTQALMLKAKQNATYWLGLLQVGRGTPVDAVQYFDRLTLQQWPDGPWTGGARFNLARVYEQIGEPAKAAALYAADVSPQFHGNRLRGRWLGEKQAQSAEAAPAESTEAE
jgi:hypothetical protein